MVSFDLEDVGKSGSFAQTAVGVAPGRDPFGKDSAPFFHKGFHGGNLFVRHGIGIHEDQIFIALFEKYSLFQLFGSDVVEAVSAVPQQFVVFVETGVAAPVALFDESPPDGALGVKQSHIGFLFHIVDPVGAQTGFDDAERTLDDFQLGRRSPVRIAQGVPGKSEHPPHTAEKGAPGAVVTAAAVTELPGHEFRSGAEGALDLKLSPQSVIHKSVEVLHQAAPIHAAVGGGGLGP